MAKQPMLDLVPFAGSRWEVAYLDFQAKVVAQLMLDLVPFAGSRWEVAYLDFQAKVVAQLLQFHFPQPIAATVAAATVGRDQQTRCLRMASLSQFVPPASNGRDRELGGVAADADAHPGFVATQVVDSVGDRLALA